MAADDPAVVPPVLEQLVEQWRSGSPAEDERIADINPQHHPAYRGVWRRGFDAGQADCADQLASALAGLSSLKTTGCVKCGRQQVVGATMDTVPLCRACYEPFKERMRQVFADDGLSSLKREEEQAMNTPVVSTEDAQAAIIASLQQQKRELLDMLEEGIDGWSSQTYVRVLVALKQEGRDVVDMRDDDSGLSSQAPQEKA